MPAYGTGQMSTLSAGYPTAVWNDENVAVNACSQAANMRRNPNMPNCLSIELLFAANPGAFGIEAQFADTNEDKYFVTRAPNYTSGLSTGFAGRIEYTDIVAKYVRLKMASLTNAVKVTAKLF